MSQTKENAIKFQQAEYLISCAQPAQFPEDDLPEIVFAGRSNVGKSSVLNRLCRQKQLARTSKTPGRTQLINFFTLPGKGKLVDLPGYGFAKVSNSQKDAWKKLIESYLMNRPQLKAMVLIMDIRHPLQPMDEQMLSWCVNQQLPVHVILNKADKFKRGKSQQIYLGIKKELSDMQDLLTLQAFSASKGDGLEELEGYLNRLMKI